MLSSLATMGGALAITLGVLALSVVLLRRLQNVANGSGGRGVPLRVVQRVSVGPKQAVGVLQVADRVLVVSIAEGGTSLLTELTGPACAEILAVPAAPSLPLQRERPARRNFVGRHVPIVGKVAMLALALTLASSHAFAASPRRPTATAGNPAITSPAPAASPRVAAPSPTTPRVPVPTVNAPLPPKVNITLGEGSNALRLDGTVGLVVFLGVLTLLPALFLLMTSFTRILIVLHFLRSALGTQTTPPQQLLVAVAVLLTGVIMNPVLQDVNKTAIQPYFAGQITQGQAYEIGVKPFRAFMLRNTREQDLALFTDLSHARDARSVDQVPTVAVVSAFVTSELRTSFQMGFVIFLPFVVVDLIVASVLMSLGMFMLPPVMISLPFKLLLFVLADGWTLVVQNLVNSFR